MKKILILMLSMFMLTGCSVFMKPSSKNEQPRLLSDYQRLYFKPFDLDDIKVSASSYLKQPKIDKTTLTKKIIEDKENDVKDVCYYEEETLKYIELYGYGEGNIKKYYINDDEIVYIENKLFSVSNKQYTCEFNNQKIETIIVRQSTGFKFDNQIIYRDNQIDTIYYKSNESYNMVCSEDNELFVHSLFMQKKDNQLYKGKPDFKDHNIHMILGQHQLYFDASNNWYIEGDTYISCTNKASANALKQTLSNALVENINGHYYVVYNQTFKLSNKYIQQDKQHLLILDAFNDYYDVIVHLNDKNEIKSFTRSSDIYEQ